MTWLTHAAAGLDARRNVGIDEVQRHLHVDLVILVDALEVDVQHLLLVGVHWTSRSSTGSFAPSTFSVRMEAWNASLRSAWYSAL